jgi:hypothetical protein
MRSGIGEPSIQILVSAFTIGTLAALGGVVALRLTCLPSASGESVRREEAGLQFTSATNEAFNTICGDLTHREVLGNSSCETYR